MKSTGHTVLAGAAWLAACTAARATGVHVTDQAALAGVAVAAGWGEWPDMDTGSTPSAALGWVTRGPALLIEWLAGHRGATHWAATTCAAASLLAGAQAAGITAAAPLAAFLGLVWAEAALPGGRRLQPFRRALLCLAATTALLLWAGAAWLPYAVLTGGLAHLAGDCLTRRKYRMLAPFWWRPVGGLGLIPPTPPGVVSVQERAVTATAAAVGCGCAVLTAPGGLPVLAAGFAVLLTARAVWGRRRRRGWARH